MYNLGLSLDGFDREDEALECYVKSLVLDPKDVNAWNNKGAILITSVNFKKHWKVLIKQ